MSEENSVNGIRVSVTGAKGEDSQTKDMVAKEVQKNTERWSKFSGINMLNITIGRHDKGGTVKYSVNAEATGDGSCHADAHDWSLEKAMQEAMAKLDKELLKKKEKAGPGMFRRIFRRNAEE